MAETTETLQLVLAYQHDAWDCEQPSSSTNRSLAVHRWTNWIAGFSGEFARSAIRRYLPFPRPDSIVLDPFAGVGTTLLEAYRQGIDCVGFEINPFAALVSRLKLNAPNILVSALKETIARYQEFLKPIEVILDQTEIVEDGNHLPRVHSTAPQRFKSRIPFFSPKVEKKVLYTLDFLFTLPKEEQIVFRVALASVMVEFSNYSYEPSLGSRPAAGKQLVINAAVCQIMINKLHQIVDDVEEIQMELSNQVRKPQWELHAVSFFDAKKYLEPGTIDLVVTSPPYVNNYHYVRSTRPQLFWIDLVAAPQDLKQLEDHNFGKSWQTVRGAEQVGLEFSLPSLESKITMIRDLNPDKEIYGGRGWANYVTTYMNDMYRLCILLDKFLRPDGRAVVVVGNSVIQGIELAVDEFLCNIAAMHGLRNLALMKPRDRTGSSIVNSGLRTVGEKKAKLYDAVVVLGR